jgi:hypothetical protein
MTNRILFDRDPAKAAANVTRAQTQLSQKQMTAARWTAAR